MTLPKTEFEYHQFIERFESGTLLKGEWHHAEHVAMAFWYLHRLETEAAINKIRMGIQRLNKKHGVVQTETSGYHETWTVFFSKMLSVYMKKRSNSEHALISQLHDAIEWLKDFRTLTREYYSKERIMSWEARTQWLPPDLKSLSANFNLASPESSTSLLTTQFGWVGDNGIGERLIQQILAGTKTATACPKVL